MFFTLFNSKPLYLRAQTELEQNLDIYIDVEFCQESIFHIPKAIWQLQTRIYVVYIRQTRFPTTTPRFKSTIFNYMHGYGLYTRQQVSKSKFIVKST